MQILLETIGEKKSRIRRNRLILVGAFIAIIAFDFVFFSPQMEFTWDRYTFLFLILLSTFFWGRKPIEVSVSEDKIKYDIYAVPTMEVDKITFKKRRVLLHSPGRKRIEIPRFADLDRLSNVLGAYNCVVEVQHDT